MIWTPGTGPGTRPCWETTLPSEEERGRKAGLPGEKGLKGRLRAGTRADQPFQLPDFWGQTAWSPVPGLPELSHCGMETGWTSILYEIHMV